LLVKSNLNNSSGRISLSNHSPDSRTPEIFFQVRVQLLFQPKLVLNASRGMTLISRASTDNRIVFDVKQNDL
jgi:hypothetical protein